MYNVKSRKTFAEFIIAQALNIESLNGVEWDLYDLIYKENRITVKSSEVTDPLFDIRISERFGKRVSDIYVFALYSGETVDEPYNKSLWNFWVLSTPNIDKTFEGQETVSLELITPIAIKVDYNGLRSAVDLVVSFNAKK